jgi:hypothetical protein
MNHDANAALTNLGDAAVVRWMRVVWTPTS